MFCPQLWLGFVPPSHAYHVAQLHISVCWRKLPTPPTPAFPNTQVVRSRLQQRQDAARAVRYTGVWATFRLILRREGLAGFYKGVVPNVLRVMPQSAITFLCYERVMQLLEWDWARRPFSEQS